LVYTPRNSSRWTNRHDSQNEPKIYAAVCREISVRGGDKRMLIKINSKFGIPEILFGMILAVLIFALGAMFSSQNAPNNKAADYQHSEEAKQKPTSPPTEDLIFGHPALDVYTGALAVATILLMFVTALGIRNQSKDTRIIQRAYLTVSPAGIEPFRSLDGRLSCDVFFENSGNLPAQHVSWIIYQKFSTDHDLKDFPINPEQIGGNNLIPPRGKIRKGAPPINSAELDAFRHRQQETPDSCWLFIWGTVRYSDGFNSNRFVDFCYRYYLAGNTWTISHEHGRQHEHGNRTDES
jgi:hypothetical protein